MRLINVKTRKLESFVGGVPPYAILSHTWGKDEEELSFHDIQTGNIEKAGKIKLEGCCEQAKKDNLEYAWIDTCCINKDSSRELDEAINSMFRWYQEASICYAYLSDVPSEDNPKDPGSRFSCSRWFRRGWTLQELLAPKDLHFFDQTWTSIGTKVKMSGIVEKITGIPGEFLRGWTKLYDASVAQRIFDVTMPMIYGEGDKAFGRLQEEIMKKTRDDSILAWGFSTAESTPSKSTDSGTHEAMNRRYWLYIDGQENINLELNENDVHPPVRWENGRAMIAEAKDSDENIIRRYLARFRTQDKRSRDLVVVLEFETQGPQTQARCHVMTGSRDTALQNLSQKLIYMRPEAFGKQSARNGTLDVEVTVKEEYVAQEPMFVVRLARASSSPVATVDATRELQLVDLKLECVRILQEEDQIHLEMERWDRQGEEYKLLSRKSEIQQRLDILDTKRGPGNWLETIIKTLLDAGKIDRGLKDVGDSDSDSQQLSRVPGSGHSTGGQIPLLWAAANGRLAVLKLLVEKGAQLEARDNDNKTPLMIAAQNGHEAMAKLLVEKGAQLEAKNNNGWTPLMFAAGQGHEAMAKLLVKKSAQLEAKSNNNKTPLIVAAQYGQKAVAKLLVEKGAQLEAKDKDGWTPLMFATWQGHEVMAKLLVEKGAQLEAKNKYDWTPLMVAVQYGQEAVAKLLVEKGAQLKAKNNNGWTPLMFAPWQGHEAVAKLLVEKGAQLEAKDSNNKTPLIVAVQYGQEAVAKLLVKKGAQLKAKNNNGKTPLMVAIQNGHEAVARLLVKKGAQIEAKNNNGKTPLMVAVQNGHEAVAKLLR
ncbi:hypothetical protein DL771_008746 [Monosporascus sp. 5C6A]|nr:hypothetical protein DL771_008746 [Monosporascus sp. 5C6A]